jgi:endoglucanase
MNARPPRRAVATSLVLALIAALATQVVVTVPAVAAESLLKINDKGYFATRGLNVLVFSNWYDSAFSDSKISGVEIIHHEVRTATNGDVRLSATPGQWDPIGKLVDRKVDAARGTIEAFLSYPDFEFSYAIKAEARDDGVVVSVNTDKALPARLEGRAGFNLELLPSAYMRKTFMVDGKPGVFPLYPSSSMTASGPGAAEPLPIATGRSFVLAPEDPARRVTITSSQGEMMLFDGRNQAQNGWFVLRSAIPKGKSGRVVEWFLSANTVQGWLRTPVVAHSQVGYAPSQRKVAVIELDPNDVPKPGARLLRVTEKGEFVEALAGEAKPWGRYLRYNYLTFDFSAAREAGTYVLEYDGERTKPFRIAPDVYADAWHPTLDVFFPVQMDHMFVNEAYRVWHGVAHVDDARQAPVNHEHIDLYRQGPTTDTPYAPGAHIPGLNVGGWFDAGDFDIRTQTQYLVVRTMVEIWERFGLKRDQTTIDQSARYVDMHVPDGVPDLLQQIEHGTLQLLAQHKAVGRAIHGIVEPDVAQYTHLGDASTKTDGRVFDASLKVGEVNGDRSGTPDDRWAFTSKSTPLNYGSIAALAAASRALRGYRDALADECLATAKRVWDEEHSHAPDIFQHGNTTGGPLDAEEFTAAVELLITTKDQKYAKRVEELWPAIEKSFGWNATLAVRALPFMNDTFRKAVEARVRAHRDQLERIAASNPFGVLITTGGWAGSGTVLGMAATNYELHKAFPEIIEAEWVLRGLNFVYGCHPGSDVSFVSGVGTVSKEVAYGNNRADFSFIAGGVVPGVLVIKPDFPENKEDWPFLWGENEYVINEGSTYMLLVNAANELVAK